MSRRYFGTDGVRGPVGGALVNPHFFARLSAAAVEWTKCAAQRELASFRQGSAVADSHRSLRVLIGRDTRASGTDLERGVVAGVRAAGGEPVLLGILPTPAVARAVKATGAALGVVITASHNPARDNGIKFFTNSGTKLTDADEAQIEDLLPETVPMLAGGQASEMKNDVSALADYVSGHTQLLPPKALVGWRIAVDTANGATVGATPVVLRALGAEVVGLGDAPDGHNINAGIGSEHPERVAALVRESGARLGVVHDGDGDRCILVDESGEVLDGDEILTILALDAIRRGTLAQHTLVITVQSNLGVDVAIGAAGGRVLRTSVGDRYVSERMRAEGALLGGESSGHIICADVSPTGDGLVTALRVIDVVRRSGQPLSVLRKALKKFPQKTAALPVRERRELVLCPQLQAAIRKWEITFSRDGGERSESAGGDRCCAVGDSVSPSKTDCDGSTGRVMVRYSGTELKLRFLVEAQSETLATEALAELEAAAAADGLF